MAEIECLESLSTEPMEKAVSAFLGKSVRSLSISIQPYPAVCSALPSKEISASCHGFQGRSANFGLEEILWPDACTAGRSSLSLTTKSSRFDITDASFQRFLLAGSLPVESTTSLLYHPIRASLDAVINKERFTEYWVSFFTTKSSKSDVVTALSNSPVLVNILIKQSQIPQALEDVLSGAFSS